jgi:hypothetical protein
VRVGKETTIVTGPIDADGNIDYEAALNERLRKTITPETSASVLLLKAAGPRPMKMGLPPGFFRPSFFRGEATRQSASIILSAPRQPKCASNAKTQRCI